MNRFFRIICALVGLGTASCGQKAYVELSAKQFGQLIQSTPNIQLVDVRTEEEYRKSRLEHAVLIDINKPEFKQQAERTLRKDHPVAVYCRRGRRSAKAAASKYRCPASSCTLPLSSVKRSAISSLNRNAWTIWINTGTYPPDAGFRDPLP